MLETVSTVLICIGGVIGVASKIIREKINKDKMEELIDKAVTKRLEKNN